MPIAQSQNQEIDIDTILAKLQIFIMMKFPLEVATEINTAF